MHNGAIAHFKSIKYRILNVIRNSTADFIQGTSDSEYAGALLIHYLPDKDPNSPHSGRVMKKVRFICIYFVFFSLSLSLFFFSFFFFFLWFYFTQLITGNAANDSPPYEIGRRRRNSTGITSRTIISQFLC